MNKTIVIIDDNDFFLRKVNLKIKKFLQDENYDDKVKIILVNKDDIFSYRNVEHIDIALVDFSFILPDETVINGVDMSKEIFEKHSGVKVAIISSLPDAEDEVKQYNEDNETQIALPNRNFPEIIKFIQKSLSDE